MKTAEETISGQGVMVYLMEELTDARLRCEQLKHYVAEASKIISASSHKDHFWEAAGHLMHGIPETLFKLDKALSATALAAGKLDHEALKQNIRPEKADELERVLEDARIRYVHRRSGENIMIGPKQATEALRRMADDIDTTGGFPLGPMVQLIAALEGRMPQGPASKMASVPTQGLVVPAGWLRTLADTFEPKAGETLPNRERLASSIRRLLSGVMSSSTLALLQSAGSREEVMDGFKKENPDLTEAQLKEIADQWEANKDVVKDKTAAKGDGSLLRKVREGFLLDTQRAINLCIRNNRSTLSPKVLSALKHATELLQDVRKILTSASDEMEQSSESFKTAGTGDDFQNVVKDKTATDMSPALAAFSFAVDTARAAKMAATAGNSGMAAMQGIGTMVNMLTALETVVPRHADALHRLGSMSMRMMSRVKSEARREDAMDDVAQEAFKAASAAAIMAFRFAQRGKERYVVLTGIATISHVVRGLQMLSPENAGDLATVEAKLGQLKSVLLSGAVKENVLATDLEEVQGLLVEEMRAASFDPLSDFNSSLVRLGLKLKDAETEIEDAAGFAWKAWKAIADYQGGGTQNAMKQLGPSVLNVVSDIRKQRSLIHKIRGFALAGVPVTASESDKDSKFTKGEPADPTENMTEEQAAEWKAQNEANRDKFKSADWKADKEAALVIPEDMSAFLIDVANIFGRKHAKTRFTQGGPDVRKTILGPMVTAHYKPYNLARVDTLHITWVEGKSTFKIDVFGSIPSDDVESEGFQQTHATDMEKATSYTMDPDVIARVVMDVAETMHL